MSQNLYVTKSFFHHRPIEKLIFAQYWPDWSTKIYPQGKKFSAQPDHYKALYELFDFSEGPDEISL